MKQISNFDTFIFEGKYNSLVLELSRDYINEFKTFLKSTKKTLKIKKLFTIEDIVSIRFKTKNNPKLDYAFDIIAYVEWDVDDVLIILDISITINKDFFPMAFNDFIAEIKETLRHEIEHVSQENNPNKFIDDAYDKKGDKTFAEYILSSNELPAHLHGFLTKAKTLKISMNSVIDNFLFVRKAWFYGHEHNYNIVRQKLIERGKKMFPMVKWD